MKYAAKILLIGLEPATQEAVRGSLRGYRVITVPGGSAVTEVRNEMPDLAIFGASLHEEMVQALQKVMGGKPILLLFMENGSRMVLKVLKPGIRDRLNEPFELSRLQETVEKLLCDRTGEAVALPMDVEILISEAVDDMAREEVPLAGALQRFTEKYIELLTTKLR